MATEGTGPVVFARVIEIGDYSITRHGNSKGINCFKALDGHDFPSEEGTPMKALLRERGPDGEPELVVKPIKNGE